MAAAAGRVIEYTDGLDFEGLLADRRTYDAVVRNLEILGEAAGKVPQETRALMPEIDFRRLGAMRNILAHVYFGIDDDILWDVISRHAPLVLRTVERFRLAERGTTGNAGT